MACVEWAYILMVPVSNFRLVINSRRSTDEPAVWVARRTKPLSSDRTDQPRTIGGSANLTGLIETERHRPTWRGEKLARGRVDE